MQQLTRRLWTRQDEGRGHHHPADGPGAALVASRHDALYPAIQHWSEVVP
ncbi:hypothetical protein I546_4510 [Mycobacterium kansasii 732]|nr:hypothetical protein [Mycobacterium pseudokansasii]EUA08453.1 hypothetical protein I546_4510 [Mycobacterium kansasii 732]